MFGAHSRCILGPTTALMRNYVYTYIHINIYIYIKYLSMCAIYLLHAYVPFVLVNLTFIDIY